MLDGHPGVDVKMRVLVAANRALIRAERRHVAAAVVMECREAELRDARRALRLALESMQPELPSAGELPGTVARDD